ncbi:amidohydrolase family protein [Parasphingorhabdus sp.]|uniref:N-acyl-D-amino-acid deacylase family protein n=1 Tax=Parasphingorhabdus sp. TaxID=2709688 RepID=UPI0032ED81E5
MAYFGVSKRFRVIAALFTAALWLIFNSAAEANEYDIVIRSGRVIDGTGAPGFFADVAIRDGYIVKIGKVIGRGDREIDAKGRVVSPGWVDIMDQSGSIFLTDARAPNKIRMGVTTAIAGEIAPPVAPNELAKYFDTLEKQGLVINFGTLYSLGEIRRRVMGDTSAAPSDIQLDQMKKQVACAMEQGALGVSSALVYPPGVFQTRDELTELSKVAASYGGFYASHIRDEGIGLVAAIEEAVAIGEAAGLPVEIYHLKAAYRPLGGELMSLAIAAIERARRRGVDVSANLYPYTAAATGLDVTIPPWVFADGKDKAIARLRDPEVRSLLKKQVAAGAGQGWSNFVASSGGWNNIILANPFSQKYERHRLRSIADIARDEAREPADLAWDIMLEGQPNRPLAFYFMMDEADVELALQASWTSIGTDAAAAAKLGEVDALGLAHPRSYGSFARVIAEYVKRRKVLTLEEAIRKMSSLPAGRAGLHDRGRIHVGLRGDLIVFDLETIKDHATWHDPTLPAVGVDYVLVNGELVLDAGHDTSARPGSVLRGKGTEMLHLGAPATILKSPSCH